VLFNNSKDRRPKFRSEPILVVTSDFFVILLAGFMGTAIGLSNSTTFSFLGLPTGHLTISSFAFACSFSNCSCKVANSLSAFFSFSTLLIRVKNAKSSPFCFGAIAPYKHMEEEEENIVDKTQMTDTSKDALKHIRMGV
jgi:hypothetical protein